MIHIISTFESSNFLELAITELEERGLNRSAIFAVPMEKKGEKQKLFDTIHRADGISLFDGAAALATVGMLLGSIYGFVLEWGPIIWAIIGLLSGAVLGFILDFFMGRKSVLKKKTPEISTEVVVIVQCKESQFDVVEQVLWEHLALGVSKIIRLERKNEEGG